MDADPIAEMACCTSHLYIYVTNGLKLASERVGRAPTDARNVPSVACLMVGMLTDALSTIH